MAGLWLFLSISSVAVELEMTPRKFHILKNRTYFFWFVAPGTHAALINDFSFLEDVKPLREGSILGTA